MIKKAQKRFIIVSSSIIFILFLFVYACSIFFINDSYKNIVSNRLLDMQQNFTSSIEKKAPEKTIITIVSGKKLYGTQNFDFYYDQNTFSDIQAENIVRKIISSKFYSGKDGNYYYKAFDIQDKTAIVYSDMSETLQKRASTILVMSLIIVGLFTLMIYIVIRLSKKVFEPIKTMFNKQKQFISDASHELKTPLAIISANADVISSSGDSEWVQNIKSQTNRMNTLVGDMLSLAKIEEEKPLSITEEFNLSEVINDVVLSFDAVAFENGKDLSCQIDDNVIVKGDKTSINKIMNILLDNAVKHSDQKGQIKVSLNANDNHPILSVWNTGCKVPNGATERMFERFFRGDTSRSRDSGGSGLGLSIAQGLAIKNKWSISAKSEFGVFTQIIIRF